MDREVERRLELAAAIGVDPGQLWPAHSGRSRWSRFEVDAYSQDGVAPRKLRGGHTVGARGEGAPQLENSRQPIKQKVPREHAPPVMGAAGKFLLTSRQAETERLKSLRETRLLDSGVEEISDRIVAATRKFFDVGAASMSLIAEDAQYFKSVVGPLREETPRQIALCTATVELNAMLIIHDTFEEERFASNPLVLGAPHIRFYAGYPLHGPRGWNIGTLCIFDQKPRAFPPAEQQVLRTLASIVQHHIDARVYP